MSLVKHLETQLLVNRRMKNKLPNRIAGVHAAPSKPTPLGAALFAATVSFPIGVVLILMDLLLP
jgi:hypothetical protein